MCHLGCHNPRTPKPRFELTRPRRRSYPRSAMPAAPEPPRRTPPDLSAIPSFLRGAPDAERPAHAAAPAQRPPRPIAMPRPATPAPSQPEPRKAPQLDPASLPMPSLSRRRVVTVAGALVAALLALSFA